MYVKGTGCGDYLKKLESLQRIRQDLIWLYFISFYDVNYLKKDFWLKPLTTNHGTPQTPHTGIQRHTPRVVMATPPTVPVTVPVAETQKNEPPKHTKDCSEAEFWQIYKQLRTANTHVEWLGKPGELKLGKWSKQLGRGFVEKREPRFNKRALLKHLSCKFGCNPDKDPEQRLVFFSWFSIDKILIKYLLSSKFIFWFYSLTKHDFVY